MFMWIRNLFRRKPEPENVIEQIIREGQDRFRDPKIVIDPSPANIRRTRPIELDLHRLNTMRVRTREEQRKAALRGRAQRTKQIEDDEDQRRRDQTGYMAYEPLHPLNPLNPLNLSSHPDHKAHDTTPYCAPSIDTSSSSSSSSSSTTDTSSSCSVDTSGSASP